MAKRYPVRISFTATPEIQGNLAAVSERFNLPLSQIIRECIESDLPRLVDRYKKRTNKPNPIVQLDSHDS
jgi:predicted DNA-binding protein